MNEAQKILDMIEAYHPDAEVSKEYLDEIDARVWCYLNGYIFAKQVYDKVYSICQKTQCETEVLNGVCTLRYTRSRDALKSIRPEGWDIHIGVGWANKGCTTNYTKIDAPLFTSGDLPTEELAELHAIIQAIEYERKD